MHFVFTGIWRSERVPPAGTGLYTNAWGISNRRAGDPASVVAVGVSSVDEFQYLAAKWTRSVAGWQVQVLGTLPGDSSSYALGVHDHGAIVGISQNAATVGRGFHWTEPAPATAPPAH